MKLVLNRLRRLGSDTSAYRQRKRRRQSLALLAQSELFDRAWYLQSYPDVRDSGIDPVRHYLESGWREGRDPGPDFCTTAYLKGNSDVAALGINPLLHYIEHGRFEGRGAVHHGAPFRATFSPEERFGPAAPCVRFDVPRADPVRWTRSGRIEADGKLSASLDRLTVATFRDEQQRRTYDGAMEQLAWFSGREADAPLQMHASAGTTLDLRDAWQAGAGILRTRWSPSERPMVVRAVQHVGEQAMLLGEGCIERELDFVDVRPANPFFPLLFLFTTADGEFAGFRQLSFPALCRGGIYYPELIALSRAAETATPSSIPSIDERLAARLLAIRTGTATPTVAGLAVTLEGADGTHPLFLPEYQQWLADVMRAPVAVAGQASGPAQDYLAATVTVDARPARAAGIATLKLASDMVPALSALLLSEAGTASDELAGSLIVTAPDGNIGTLVHVPAGTPASDFGSATAVPSLSPRDPSRGLPNEPALLAIRLPPRRPVADAELLVPTSSIPEPLPEGPASITWLLWPEQWSEPELLQSLEALAIQTAGTPEIIFVGQTPKGVTAYAEQLLGAQVRGAGRPPEAVELIGTNLAGYIGPAVLLHDRRTVALLAAALDKPGMLTATALVVAAERRGKGSSVVPGESRTGAEARLLPGAIVPVAEPLPDFWISRADLVRQWVQQGAEQPAGRHVCSTQVAVSRLSWATAEPPIAVPAAPQDRCISTEALVG